MPRCLATLFTATLLLAAACGSDPTAPVDPPPKARTTLPRPLTASEERVRDASNSFAFGLLREVGRAHRGANVFISPLSASMALGMTLNGARGETRDAMRAALGVTAGSVDVVNAGYKSLITLLRELDTSTDMRIANSVWSRTGFAVEPEFTTAVRDYFGATARELDFDAPSARGTINSWVSENTAGKIKTIVDDPIPSDLVIYLINAVYFKGVWRDAFDRSDTRDEQFRAPGQSSTVKMMHQTADSAGYYRAPGVTLVELPYGNGAYAMTIALPDSAGDVEALVDALTPAQWAAWTAALREQKVDLALPRFRIEWADSLNEPLKTLGMGVAFTGRADFTGINRNGGLYISEVKQKTYVDVNEEGTEAAAATSVGIGLVSLPIIPVVRVDRPFLVAIRERLTGSILFLGKITAPAAP